MTTITCAWCGAAMGTKPGPDGVSHSVCERCAAKRLDNLETWFDEPDVAYIKHLERLSNGERGTSPGRGLVELASWTIHDTNRPTRAEER